MKNRLIKELQERYEENGHFIFTNENQILRKHLVNVPDKPGIYCFVINDELIYIGKAGTILKNGCYGEESQKLQGRLGNRNYQPKVDGLVDSKSLPRQAFFRSLINGGGVEAIKVFWFVTDNDSSKDYPEFAEAYAIQEFLKEFKRLPKWNNKF